MGVYVCVTGANLQAAIICLSQVFPFFNACFKFHNELSGKAENWEKRKVDILLRWTNWRIDKTWLQWTCKGNRLTECHHSSSAPLMRPNMATGTNITSANVNLPMPCFHHVSYMVWDLKVWGLNGALFITSSCCILLFCNGSVAYLHIVDI